MKLPEIKEEEQAADNGDTRGLQIERVQIPHVWFGAFAIFMYMGLEIGIPSMLSAYFDSKPDLGGKAEDFLPLYWGGMMVGRFIGAGVLSKYQPRHLLTVCLLGGAACVGISFVLPGMAAVCAMLAAGLFHSVMWPLIFNLGFTGIGSAYKSCQWYH